jgi:hypothetical protein
VCDASANAITFRVLCSAIVDGKEKEKTYQVLHLPFHIVEAINPVTSLLLSVLGKSKHAEALRVPAVIFGHIIIHSFSRMGYW